MRTRDKFHVPKAILEQAGRLATELGAEGTIFSPLNDIDLYEELVEEGVGLLARETKGDALILTDVGTVFRTLEPETVAPFASQFTVFGDRESKSFESVEMKRVNLKGDLTVHDHFFIAVSERIHLAILGRVVVDGNTGERRFDGCWSTYPKYVRDVANILAQSYDLDEIETASEQDDPAHVAAMTLSSRTAQYLAHRQDSAERMKDDLFSVLNILKAISSKRRAHDILYVFVERIAKVIDADRCSVVRVFGGQRVAHVVASHDNKEIVNLEIELSKYPEIQRAIETRKKVVIPDVFEDPLTKPFTQELNEAEITSINIIPMVMFDPQIGSLFLRAVRKKGTFSMREISFCEIAAEAAANALERAHLFESIQEANQQLEQLAVTDGLTNLYNHRYFRERLEEEFERARRYEQPLSFMIIDIDNFKQTNDTYGHLQGDNILREVGYTIRASVRRNDIVARYGGEEFVVLMPQTDQQGGLVEAERLCQEVRGRTFAGLPEGTRVTVSIGLAEFDPKRMDSPEGLVSAADRALYEAKNSGKDKVVEAS